MTPTPTGPMGGVIVAALVLGWGGFDQQYTDRGLCLTGSHTLLLSTSRV